MLPTEGYHLSLNLLNTKFRPEKPFMHVFDRFLVSRESTLPSSRNHGEQGKSPPILASSTIKIHTFRFPEQIYIFYGIGITLRVDPCQNSANSFQTASLIMSSMGKLSIQSIRNHTAKGQFLAWLCF